MRNFAKADKKKHLSYSNSNMVMYGIIWIKKEYINPKKLPVANASYEPDGETISEEEEEKQNPTFVQFMQRIEQLPEVTREAIKNCGNDPAIAKAALEISGIDK